MTPTTQIRDHFQRIPYEPANDGRLEMHSGLSRHYPTLHADLVAAPEYSTKAGGILCHPGSNFLSHFLLKAITERGIPAIGDPAPFASAGLRPDDALMLVGAHVPFPTIAARRPRHDRHART